MKAVLQWAIIPLLCCTYTALFGQRPEVHTDDEKCIIFTPSVVAPARMCAGECHVVSLSFFNPSATINYTVTKPDGIQLSYLGPTFLFCPDQLGTYNIEAYTPGSALNPYPQTVTLVDNYIPAVTASAVQACPGNDDATTGGNNCQRVCEGATVVYTADNSLDLGIEWEVSGAEHVDIDDNKATVVWGTAGYGNINVSIIPPPEPLLLNCESILLPSSNTSEDGSVAIHIEGGAAPYEIHFAISNGLNLTRPANPGMNVFEEMPAGTYTIEVVDAEGQSVDCGFTLLFQTSPDAPCVRSPAAVITLGEPDEMCCLLISAEVVGGTPHYTYAWSHGATSPSSIVCGTGTYSVTVTDGNGCTTVAHKTINTTNCLPACMGDNQICVEILPAPEAEISTPIGNSGDTLFVCAGQNISFNNTSTFANSYAWSFGDDSYSSNTTSSHTYETGGFYEVELLAFNECYCVDTTRLFVQVDQALAPDILCQGTLCQGATSSYHTEVNCDAFIWEVSNNGLIQAGGGVQDSFVVIQWLNGQEGTITLSTPDCGLGVCEAPNTVTIPLMQNGGVISGPDILCALEHGTFRVPNYSGTSIEWSVSPNGQIVSPTDLHEAIAFWENTSENAPSWIAVRYENCYLDCDGVDTFQVQLLPPFHLEGAPAFCENAPLQFHASRSDTAISVAVDWAILDAQLNPVWQGSTTASTLNEALNLPVGNYFVQGSLPNTGAYCNATAMLPFNIKALPAPPQGINGDSLLCPGQTALYSVLDTDNSSSYLWRITNGTTISEREGYNIVVNWGEVPPFEISVHKIANTSPACLSDPFTWQLMPHPGFDLLGPALACVNTSSTFSASTTPDPFIDWQLEPANAGTIVPGSNPYTIEVYWNSPGLVTLFAESCGLMQTRDIMVNSVNQPSVNYPESVCPGTYETISLSEPYAEYAWYRDDLLVSNLPEPDFSAGTYRVEVTHANGCASSAVFEINAWPAPTASISVGGYPALCPGGIPANILALNEDVSYTYNWYRNGQLLNATNDIYSTTQTGTYQVEVTDQNGCMASSNFITLQNCDDVNGTCFDGACIPDGVTGPGTPLPGCTPNDTISFLTEYLSCDSLRFNNLYTGFLPGSLTWIFGDINGSLNSTSNAAPPVVGYDLPGVYVVIIAGEIPGDQGGPPCPVGVFQNVRVPAKALFDVVPNCPGIATPFFDRTILLPDETIIDWNWDFGDPTSPNNTATGPNPDHVYESAGTYTVTLSVTLASGCETSTQMEIDIPTPPASMIQLPMDVCEQQALLFTVSASNELHLYNWIVTDTAGALLYASQGDSAWFSFPSAGNYEINLAITDEIGCLYQRSEIFAVAPNDLDGQITIDPDQTICAGDSVTLHAPAGATAWQWSNGADSPSITVMQDAIVSLVTENILGCTYRPGSVGIEVLDPPVVNIESVEFNEQGQIIQVYDDYRSICYGDRIFLQTEENANYTYEWSNGDTGFSTEFSPERDTILPMGTHYMTVNTTDETTGCSFSSPPFQIDVYPNPAFFLISSSEPRCEGEPVDLFVTDPADSLTYHWTNGATGDTITTLLGGSYRAYAQNQYGCASPYSPQRLVVASPNISDIQTGCFQVCFPDTICALSLGSNWQYRWFHNGNPLSATFQNNQTELVVTAPGEYWLEYVYGANTSAFNCEFRSSSIFIEESDGPGNMLGMVVYDLNNNGEIDPTDSLASNLPILLYDENDQLLNTVLTDSSGHYQLDSLLSSNQYKLRLDTSGLTPHWQIDSLWRFESQIGCGLTLSNNWLLRPVCQSSPWDVVEIDACPPLYELYQSVYDFVGDSIDLAFDTGGLCDSLVRWHLKPLAADSINFEFSLCESDSLVFDGQTIWPGESRVFQYQNAAGCDSIVAVQTSGLPISANELEVFSCPEVPIVYEGVSMLPGMQQQFTFSNQAGCDSSVLVKVIAWPAQQDTLSIAGCLGSSVSFAGQSLPVGSEQLFLYQNAQGCDSSIMVYATPLLVTHDTLYEAICPGTFFSYNGENIPPGTAQTFTFTSQFGCDSLITCIISAFDSISIPGWEVQASCSDLATGQISITNAPDNYQYSIDQSNWSNQASFGNLPSAGYTLFIQDENGCMNQAPFSIGVLPELSVFVDDTVLPCDGTALSIQATSNYPVESLDWQWSDGANTATTSISSPGPLALQVSNACEALTLEYDIDYANKKLDEVFYLPNAFSPNDDGINDFWLPLPRPDIQVLTYDLKIFDRWGSLVFESTDHTKGWSGKAHQQMENPAVFVIVLEASVAFCGDIIEVEYARDITVVLR